MEKWTGKVAIVTGASSGIGLATCRLLVEKGMIVVGFARREDRLQDLQNELEGKSGSFYYFKVDLCSEDNILEAFGWVKSTFNSVDVLINNAGVLKQSDLLGNTDDWKLMFDTNVMGLNICSREAVKIMKEMEIKQGHIININSIAGQFHLPYMHIMALYSSTKRSVTAITEYMREMMCMQKLPIRVTSISPGLVETEMSAQFQLGDLKENTVLKSVDIADAVIYALSAPQRVNVSEITIRPSAEDMITLLKMMQ